MRTCVPMSSPDQLRGPALGRLLLLASAYAPAALIIGCRTAPSPGGWIAVFGGLIGLLVWASFLWWLPQAQPRTVTVSEVKPVDAEVTGYIVSYLLPIVAATSVRPGDIVGYAICGWLILTVAFVADLGSVNPLVYVFRLRVVKAKVGGEPAILLVREIPEEGASVVVTRAAGVTRLLSS
jgi:hypothetical protein